MWYENVTGKRRSAVTNMTCIRFHPILLLLLQSLPSFIRFLLFIFQLRFLNYKLQLYSNELSIMCFFLPSTVHPIFYTLFLLSPLVPICSFPTSNSSSSSPRLQHSILVWMGPQPSLQVEQRCDSARPSSWLLPVVYEAIRSDVNSLFTHCLSSLIVLHTSPIETFSSRIIFYISLHEQNK